MTDIKQDSKTISLDSSNLLILLYSWRKPILIISIAAAIVSSAVSLILKERYKSTVVLYAEQQHSFGAQILEDFPKEDLLTFGEEEDAERLLQIINSDQVRNKIIDKYTLWDVYDIKREQRSANALIAMEYQSNVSAQLTKFGSVEVAVFDEKPERARDMANDIALFADSVANRMRSDRAMTAFKYAEISLQSVMNEVITMEDSMKLLQQMGVYSYIDQIAALTEMYGTAIAEGHPDRALQLKQQMDFLSNYGTSYVNLETNLKIAYGKLNVLRKRYDLMKIDVESNIPVMRIVDYASAADKKSFPIRWLIVAMSTLSAIVFTFIILLLLDNFKRLRSEGRI
jgi:capsular polysaccharide biosynthesis protein